MGVFCDRACFGLETNPALCDVVSEDDGMVRVIEECIRAYAHVAQQDELVPLDANVIVPLAIVQEVLDITWSIATGAVVCFGGRSFQKHVV